jgi:hypothetical protein
VSDPTQLDRRGARFVTTGMVADVPGDLTGPVVVSDDGDEACQRLTPAARQGGS